MAVAETTIAHKKILAGSAKNVERAYVVIKHPRDRDRISSTERQGCTTISWCKLEELEELEETGTRIADGPRVFGKALESPPVLPAGAPRGH